METESFLERPADADTFRGSLHLPDDAVLVTQVSRLAELKGHRYIIAAAEKLPASIHFCLVGDGRLRATIEKQIAAAGLGERFHLAGLLAPADIPAVMHASDILVHCSLREGLARTLPQAMLAGKPVVSYDVDGAREVVIDGQTGLLLPAKDVAGLVSVIGQLAGDADRREGLGEAGRRLAKDRFAAKTMVDRIEQVYLQLAEASQAPAPAR
jgi:glycosyltransferase involved in cell wall biosynthesis